MNPDKRILLAVGLGVATCGALLYAPRGETIQMRGISEPRAALAPAEYPRYRDKRKRKTRRRLKGLHR